MPTSIPSDWQEYFQERAAIREYDGGYDRAEAERLALEDCREVWRRLKKSDRRRGP